MNNAIFNFREPKNETVYRYMPWSDEYNQLNKELDLQSSNEIEIPLIINGKEVRTGKTKTWLLRSPMSALAAARASRSALTRRFPKGKISTSSILLNAPSASALSRQNNVPRSALWTAASPTRRMLNLMMH